jgi:hypothetical protein
VRSPAWWSIDDIKAVTGTLAMVQRLKIRPLIVVNAARSPGPLHHGERSRDGLDVVDRRLDGHDHDVDRAGDLGPLSRYGYHICPHHISDRTVFLDAAIEGRAAHEMRGAAAKPCGLRSARPARSQAHRP